MEDRPDLREQLERVRAELEARRRTLPAHTVRVHQMAELEDLEERVRELERELATAAASKGGDG